MNNTKTYSTLKPGRKGTRRLAEKYGESLLCVRYRIDEKRGVRLKTVEIIVEEKPLSPQRFKDNDLVAVVVAFDEKEFREQLREKRAKWNPQQKVWSVPFGAIRGGPLEERVVGISHSESY